MMSYTLHRIAAALVTLAFASVIIFFFIHLIPGDPLYVLLGDVATPDQVERLRSKLALDQPIFVQYLRWLANVASGDLGNSIFFQMPVTQVIRDGAETSILLASITMIWITLIGVPVGVIAAMRHGSWLDQGLSGVAMLLASVPTFWVGLYLILIFAAWLGWLPSSGYPSIFEEGGLANLRYLLLPSLTLAAPNAALILRLTRASMLDVAREDYVRTARAKGIRPARVVFRHILRNALLAVVSAFGFTFATIR
jgi:peptide/nickel transport system permease protein